MSWYKNYPKGRPFYSRVSAISTCIQKLYFAGWLETSDDRVFILSTNGGLTLYKPEERNLRPEDEYQALVRQVKDFNEKILKSRVARLESQLSAERIKAKHADEFEPELTDFPTNEDSPLLVDMERELNYLRTMGEVNLAE